MFHIIILPCYSFLGAAFMTMRRGAFSSHPGRSKGHRLLPGPAGRPLPRPPATAASLRQQRQRLIQSSRKEERIGTTDVGPQTGASEPLQFEGQMSHRLVWRTYPGIGMLSMNSLCPVPSEGLQLQFLMIRFLHRTSTPRCSRP